MKVKDVKRDKSNFKIIDMESDISELIETPVRKPVKQLYRKNIITVMSSANEINVSWQDENGEDMYLTNSDFDSVIFSFGNGYAYIMLDYDSLSDENKAIMNDLYDELNEDDTYVYYSFSLENFTREEADRYIALLEATVIEERESYVVYAESEYPVMNYSGSLPDGSVFWLSQSHTSGGIVINEKK